MRHFTGTMLDSFKKHYQEIGVLALWFVSLLPGVIAAAQGRSLARHRCGHHHPTAGLFGSITLFGVVAQLICYKYIESVDVHADSMMDGLFFGFHAGMAIWICYGFYHILFGRKIIGNVNDLVAIFGVSCIGSCILGIAIGFLVGKLRDNNASIV